MTDSILPLQLSLPWLPYQRDIVAYLKKVDPHVWNWFTKSARDDKTAEEVRFHLLKSTYRIAPEDQPLLYDTAKVACQKLGLDVPVTIYQAQHHEGLNASLAYTPNEIHIILHGPVADKLSSPEILSLFAHEVAHFLLWHSENHELLVATEMLTAMVNDPRCHPAHVASLRLLALYCEIYCDQASLLVTNDANAVISALVKAQTGVQEINAESYLQQSREIFARGDTASKGISHPEGYIRAYALELHREGREDLYDQLRKLIEGSPGIDDLDLLAQQSLASLTRRVMDVLLGHRWLQTDVLVAHARLYFDDYVPPNAPLTDAGLATDCPVEVESLRDYFCFVLLDFVSADRDLEEAPLAAAIELADQLQIKARFLELARKELKLRKNQVEKIDRDKEKILLQAASAMVNA